MIELTRLNGREFVLNAELIKFVEHSPDTVITLINGEKIVVRETKQEVLRRCLEFRRVIALRQDQLIAHDLEHETNSIAASINTDHCTKEE